MNSDSKRSWKSLDPFICPLASISLRSFISVSVKLKGNIIYLELCDRSVISTFGNSFEHERHFKYTKADVAFLPLASIRI